MEGGFGGVKMVEIGDEAMDAAVGIVLEEVPVEAVGLAPFGALGELLAHEEEFLSGVSVLIGVEHTQIGELLPHVPGDFGKERDFAVAGVMVIGVEKEIVR